MYVIGTAGHVDHGKSTLVEALTGIDPDRLKEEKERSMTIDLGFAWLPVPASQAGALGNDEIGIVDVPGHRDFIENMLAGVGGIDLALFVVAADEGVMPQTQEHLAILDLLEIRAGIVALTKVDLIDDPDWLELVTLDLAEALDGTVLANAPVLPVSAQSGQGLKQLRQTLFEHLANVEPRSDLGRARLPIDRVFTLSGFGTIVTGTLTDGSLRVGETVEIQPGEQKGRVRGLQTHRTKREIARPGSRVAVNVSGIDKEELQRGQVLARPGSIRGTILCDVHYRHLPDSGAPLKHNVDVKLFIGSAEVMARTRVLGQKQIGPGETGWLQLALREPVATLRGDRFILRRPSPAATLGGGQILDPHPGRRHRRFRPEVLTRLETLAQGTPAELLLQTITRLEPVNQAKAIKASGLDAETADTAWQELLTEKQIVTLGRQVLSTASRQKYAQEIERRLGDFHNRQSLRLGMPREELRSRLKLPAHVFNPLLSQLAEEALLVEVNALVHLPGHEIRFTTEQQIAIDKLWSRLGQAGINSPSVKEVKAEVGENVYHALIDLDRLRQVGRDVVYATETYEQIVAKIIAFIKKHEQANAAQIRDLFQTSRKYTIALLEHLDDIQVTRRVGDNRELTK